MGFGDGCGISWTIMQTVCTLLQTDNFTNTSSLNFYRPDNLPDAQPIVSMQWRQKTDEKKIKQVQKSEVGLYLQ